MNKIDSDSITHINVISLSYFPDIAVVTSNNLVSFHCYEWSFVNCVETHGAECDFGGYYEPRQWKQSLQKATEWCLDQEDCLGITRGDD